MKLNHLNLTVTDVVETHAFFEKYFDMKSMGCNANIGFLSDENQGVLVLTSAKFVKESEVRYPNGFHIGFIQESEEQVNAINERLLDAGFDVPPPKRLHSSWTFYFTAPGDITVEVLC
jgi:lactoylglutathione lyase